MTYNQETQNATLDCTRLSKQDACSEFFWLWRMGSDSHHTLTLTESQVKYIEEQIKIEEHPTEPHQETLNFLGKMLIGSISSQCICGASVDHDLIPEGGTYGCICGSIWEMHEPTGEARMVEGPADTGQDGIPMKRVIFSK